MSDNITPTIDSDGRGDSIRVGNNKVDTTSQVVLQLLHDRGETRVTVLRDRTDVDSAHQIHYRVREYLGENGLGFVHKTDEIGKNDEAVYDLTDKGREWVRANRTELTDAITAADFAKRFSDIEQTVEDAQEQFERIDNLVDKYTTEMSRLRNDVEAVAEDASDRATKESVREMGHEVGAIRSDLDDVRVDVDSAHARTRSIEGDLEGITDHLGSLGRRLSSLETRVSGIEDEYVSKEGYQALEKRISELENDVENSESGWM